MKILTKVAQHAVRVLSFAAILTAAAPAQADYVGGGYLRAMSGCETVGWPTQVEMFRARYLPKEVDGSRSTLTIATAVGGTFTYVVWDELSASTSWRAAFGYSVWGEVYAPRPRPRVRVMERNDSNTGGATLPASSDIRMSVRIRHFNGVRGCMVEAHMMLRDRDATGLVY